MIDLETLRLELIKLSEKTSNEAIKKALAEIEELIKVNPEYVPF